MSRGQRRSYVHDVTQQNIDILDHVVVSNVAVYSFPFLMCNTMSLCM